MNNAIVRTLTLALAVIAMPQWSEAKGAAGSRDVVVVTPSNLPEEAQAPGQALLLHGDNAGSTYLYVEQKQGAQLLVLDVSVPGRIRVVARRPTEARGTYDFVQAVGSDRELLRYRETGETAVLNLSHAANPVVEATTLSGPVETLGAHTVLAAEVKSVGAQQPVARDFEVVNLEQRGDNTMQAQIPEVTQRVANDETGTQFLLNAQGLTVIRQLSVEREHESDEVRMRGN